MIQAYKNRYVNIKVVQNKRKVFELTESKFEIYLVITIVFFLILTKKNMRVFLC